MDYFQSRKHSQFSVNSLRKRPIFGFSFTWMWNKLTEEEPACNSHSKILSWKQTNAFNWEMIKYEYLHTYNNRTWIFL